MARSLQRSNEQVYADSQIIASYVAADYLEEPERSIIRLLDQQLSNMNMLDIAVGAGRTTRYFAPLVKSYVGVDSSRGMIDTCIAKFAQSFSNARFAVADMRALDTFPDHSFDFVLISFNAISALGHEDRLKTLHEIHRVCTLGGYLYFSAHNLQCAKRLFGLKMLFEKLSILHPQKSYWALRIWFLRYFIYNNPFDYPRLTNLRYAILNDGAHDFRLQHYYVTPIEQADQLSEYYKDIRFFTRDGIEVVDKVKWSNLDDDWLFYLCTNKG